MATRGAPGLVQIIAVGQVTRDDLEFVATMVNDTFGAEVQIPSVRLPTTEVYDPARGQVNSTEVLRILREVDIDLDSGRTGRGLPASLQPAPARFRPLRIPAVDPGGRALWRRILGITRDDLFMPVLNFVFGEAMLGGVAAAVSLHRLREEFYGLPANDILLLQRLEKEVLHELGHTFGLQHCGRQSCLMHYSNSVADVDLKGNEFCRDCWSLVAQATHQGGPV